MSDVIMSDNARGDLSIAENKSVGCHVRKRRLEEKGKKKEKEKEKTFFKKEKKRKEEKRPNFKFLANSKNRANINTLSYRI